MTQLTPIQLTSLVSRSPNLVASQIGEDLVLLSMDNGRYYGFQIVGNRIWAMLQQTTQVSAICDNLLAEFNVQRSVCEQEVLAFLQQLQAEDLIQVT